MAEQHSTPWKYAAIGMALVIATALITGLVIANWPSNKEQAKKEEAKPEQPVVTRTERAAAPAHPVRTVPRRVVRTAAATPTAADVEACNQYAKDQAGSKTGEVVKDALIGGAVGAGVGAAGGAIAGGGKGAGKGAAIGGAVGVAAGTVYGLNEANKHDARYVEAYRACMAGRGYTVSEAAPQAVPTRTERAAPAPPVSSAPQGAVRPAAATPTAADVEACNQYAKDQGGSKTGEVVKDALIGAVLGAGVGAAGGAAAGGGKGAGKGAAIGGIVGATAGTVYGLNEANKHDARYVEAYRACMAGRGYTVSEASTPR